MKWPILKFFAFAHCLVGALTAGEVTVANLDFNPQNPVSRVVIPDRQLVAPPQPVFDVYTYGAKGDGQTYDTAALQKAINACAGTGGTVLLRKGQFVTAALTLKERMTFYLEKDATLLGGLNPEDYPVLLPEKDPLGYTSRSLLYADQADSLILDGEGVIDGRGQQVKMGGMQWGGQRQGDGRNRPGLIRIFNSKNVVVRNLDLRNPRMWTQVYSGCQNLTLDHLQVMASANYVKELDGIDVCDCQDVVIRNCQIDAEDDGICLKTHDPRGLSNILVENNLVNSFCANGIKLGTASVGPVSRVRILNNAVLGARYGGLCLESVDGSRVSDIEVKDLDIYRVSQPLFIRLAGPRKGSGSAGSTTNLHLSHVRAIGTQARSCSKPSCSITGLPEAHIDGVSLNNCYFEMPGSVLSKRKQPPERPQDYPQSSMFGDTPAYGLYLRHARGIKLEKVVFGYYQTDSRAWMVADDADVKALNCGTLGKIDPVPLPHDETYRDIPAEIPDSPTNPGK